MLATTCLVRGERSSLTFFSRKALTSALPAYLVAKKIAKLVCFHSIPPQSGSCVAVSACVCLLVSARVCLRLAEVFQVRPVRE